MMYVKVDDVDNAKNLLDTVERHVGYDSECYREVKRLLTDGPNAKDIASELIQIMKGLS